ncbi:benzoate/H(+) symporter BenE family transporter [Arthrobacter sp. ISL-30]|uniref:benzoate/H(+) symporter BenE family transporter n=1 Tax=Arthrobacter sp. ISL-30 TaxID=2819109 RepID=UPI001BEB5991|nr:benzoate/H(+) symporter BenE family transporter [Arthrobacter sp. ISL-30]MBT2512162.1 benzoate/H(+) symporter BenE family transporter [Arthrobacter sp. ISL-30]
MPAFSPRTASESPVSAKEGLARPAIAGIVTALVGFASSFAVVLAGLRAMGATPAQASSGLLALTLAVGVGALWLSWRSRLPITLAWSTPGAALLAGAVMPDGGWPAAVGAFLVTGVLVALTGLLPALGRLLGMIPTAIAQAMLAGVLFTLCLAPFKSLGSTPLLVAPVMLCWLLMMRFAPRWSVPAALAMALAVIGVDLAINGTSLSMQGMLPALHWTTPSLTLEAVTGLAIPLFIVTMASQNIPGVAVLKSFGFTAPWRSSMLLTGAGTLAGAPFGGHAINLAALSAALAAGEEAGPDRRRRWFAGFSSGLGYLVLAAFSAALTTIVAAAPPGLLEAVAGLALLGTLATAIASALEEAGERVGACVTFLVAASGLTFAGIGAPFWALVAGLLTRAALQKRRAG